MGSRTRCPAKVVRMILAFDLGPNGGAVLLRSRTQLVAAWSWSWSEDSKGGRALIQADRGSSHVPDLFAVGHVIATQALAKGPIRRVIAETTYGHGDALLPKAQGRPSETLDAVEHVLGLRAQRIHADVWVRHLLGIAQRNMSHEARVWNELQRWLREQARQGLRLPRVYADNRHVQDALAAGVYGLDG